MSKITPRTLIYDAYRQLGVLRPGQSVSEDAVDDAMRSLNDLADSWAIERLMIYGVTGSPYTLPSGGSTFTMGPGGTLSQTAPVRVESAGLTTPGLPEHPVAVLTLDEYRAQRYGLYFDGQYPLVTMRINPPAKGGEQIVLYCWTPLTSFASPDLAYQFPAGYAQALRWNLACQLIPSAMIQAKIPQVLHQYIEQKAAESKGNIKSFHSSPPAVLDATDGGALGCGCGGYSVYTDRY
jgi:hypothetical protein